MTCMEDTAMAFGHRWVPDVCVLRSLWARLAPTGANQLVDSVPRSFGLTAPGACR
jgi:hypothetical protein